VLAAAACVSVGHRADASSAPRPLRILFVGNSQTSTNDLPAFVSEIARVTRGPRIEYRTFAPSATTLQGNWYAGSGALALLNEKWDAVVVQQGPSVLPGSRARLCQYAKLFSDEARINGARPYLLMVWPRRGGSVTDVLDSYAAAGAAAHAAVLPAGIAWAAATRRSPGLELYRSDGVHPNRTGTYLAALVVYAGIRRAPVVAPNTLVPGGNPYWIPASSARMFRDAAQEALRTEVPPQPCG